MLRYPLVVALAVCLCACGDDGSPARDGALDAPADAHFDESLPDARVFDTGPDAAPVCGNGVIESGEECDDGNRVDGDACSSSCRSTEFVINTTTAGDQGAAVDGLGGFDVAATATNLVVAWQDAAGGIRQQLLSRAGAPRTNGFDATKNDFPANRRTVGTHILPRIAPRSADDYVIAWTERGAGAATSSGRVRLFGGDGTPSVGNADEVDVGATDLSAGEITAASSFAGEGILVWRETAGDLTGRIMSGSGPISFPSGMVQLATGVGVGADFRLAPVAASTAFAILDRGAGGHLVRVSTNPLLAVGTTVVDLGARRPFGVVGSVNLSQGLLAEEAATSGGALELSRFGVGSSPATTTLTSHAAQPAVATAAFGYAVAWVEKAQTAGARDTVWLALVDESGVEQHRFQASTRMTPAGADDLGVDSPRVITASNGNVLVVWRDFGDRTGAGTAADSGAELHGRLFPNPGP